VMVAGNGEGYTYAEIDINVQCQIKPDYIDNKCSGYSNSDSCSLYEEKVDGVTIFSNGHPTGLVSLPISIGPICETTQVREWQKRERKYKCESDVDTDFDKQMERISYIKENSTSDEYADKQFNKDGTQTFSAGDMFTFTDNANACIQTCKTRKAVDELDVAADGATSDMLRDSTTYNEYYYECQDNICPSGVGEEVVNQCGCNNEFGEAAAAMQIIRIAGQDMICSDGTEEPPNSN